MAQNPKNRQINVPRRGAERTPNKANVVGKILNHYDAKATETIDHAEEKIKALENLVNGSA